MLSNIESYMFAAPADVRKGDTLIVSKGGNEIISHTCKGPAVWDRSITFELDGQIQWILGNDKTEDWLKSMDKLS